MTTSRLTPHLVWTRIRQLPNRDDPLRYVTGHFLRYTGLSRFVILNYKNYKLRFHPHSSIIKAIWLNPECRMDDFLSEYLISGDTVIDVGANVGTVTIPTSLQVGSEGSTISIEPNPRIFSYLKDNVKLNNCRNVILLNTAIGEKDGYTFISDYLSDDQNSVVTSSGIKVQMKTLDTVVKEYNIDHVTLLKIDTEGYGKYVLLGASNTLAITDCIFFETNERRLNSYGTGVKDIITIIKSAGFIVYRIAGNAKDALAIREGSAIANRLRQLNLEPIGS